MIPRTATRTGTPRAGGTGTQGGRHPYWCAADHTCSAHTITGGQHRSTPVTWDTGYGRFVATRTRTAGRDGVDRIELRVVADLHPDETVAHAQAQRLAVAVDTAVRTALHALHAGHGRPSTYQRGCRCGQCLAASTAAQRRRRATRAGRGVVA